LGGIAANYEQEAIENMLIADKGNRRKNLTLPGALFFPQAGGKGMLIHPRTPLVEKTKSGPL
jgi:hypothetical protein